MHFKATNENLTIQLDADEVAGCVNNVVRLLVPEHTQKVYLFPEEEFESTEPGLVVVGSEDSPANFLQSFRLIQRNGKLVVVSAPHRFTREQWQAFAVQLEDC